MSNPKPEIEGQQIFRELVDRALARIPSEFRNALQRGSVAIIIRDWPDPAQVKDAVGDENDMLYGLFTGIPFPEQHIDDMELPSVIYVFRGPLEEDFPDLDELADEVAITIVHEIGHLMGLDEATLEAYGYR
jgi:predicted Zn-dependent protease with MMP-like domain